MKEKGFKTLAIAAIVVAGISLAIAYAAFSQTLNINGTATVKANQWSIHYDTTAGVSTATPAAGSQATNVDANFSTTATDFTFKCNLVKPGDSITYTATVVNDGEIDATLDSITGPTVTGDGASYVDVTLSGVTQGETLAAGDSVTITIVVTYKSAITEGPAQDVDATISGSLNYVQA